MGRLAIVALPMMGMIMALQGCSRAQESFLSVEMCVVDQAGVLQLKNIMRDIARSENLEFIDNSAQQKSDLQAMGADKLLKRDATRAIDLHIEGRQGMGATAGNLGLPSYQVAIGFTEGANPVAGRRLSDRLVKALSQHWHVEVIPKGKGAFPMRSCGN